MIPSPIREKQSKLQFELFLSVTDSVPIFQLFSLKPELKRFGCGLHTQLNWYEIKEVCNSYGIHVNSTAYKLVMQYSSLTINVFCAIREKLNEF